MEIDKLYSQIKSQNFTACLMALLEALTDILWNYYSMRKWHDDYLLLVFVLSVFWVIHLKQE